jgi:hypothetical protein
MSDMRSRIAWAIAADEDIEEFPLLLQTRDVGDLIEAARQQGLCAAGLARLVIHDYLTRARSNFAQIVNGSPRGFMGGPGQ